MKLEDNYSAELEIADYADMDGELFLMAINSGASKTTYVDFYINEESARAIVMQLNLVFNLGLELQ